MSGRNLSDATLLCDQSINELNNLMMNELYNADSANYSQASPDKGISADKYNQLTKLDDDEENVDFIQMYKHFQKKKQSLDQPSAEEVQQNVQFYPQPAENQSEQELIYEQQRYQMEDQNYHLQQQMLAKNSKQRPASAGKQNKVIRPSSANVQAGRVLASQNSQKNNGMHYGGGSLGGLKNSNTEQYQPQLNNIMHGINTYSQNKLQASNMMSQRNTGITMFNSANTKPPLANKRRTRPQSAAKNQMKPARELQSVTNFTFQKAKQNQNQRSYVPESMKNTDKERLYEDKINLKKQLNEVRQENQMLKTQIQTQVYALRKKEDQLQSLIGSHYPTQIQKHQIETDNFLEEFHRREIQHSVVSQQPPAQRIKGTKSSLTGMSNKDNTILILKQKLKEVNEYLLRKDKELTDLKQTLKFTKIKEFETELALNVQESQRLRVLLEREMQRQKIDPRLVLGLKEQISQYQQIIQNLQQNQQIQQENNEKLNKKLIAQIKKFTKIKEVRKKLNEKTGRLEKKVQILQAKLNQAVYMPGVHKGSSQSSLNPMVNSSEVQLMQDQYEQQMMSQTDLINKLLKRCDQFGFPVTQEELLQLQIQQPPQLDGIEEVDEEMYVQKGELYTISLVLEATKEEKQIECTKELGLEQLRDEICQAFDLADNKSFKIRVDGEEDELELNEDNFDQVFNIHTRPSIIRLEVILENEVEEEEPEDYEEDPFEKVEHESEKVMVDFVNFDQVELMFKELKSIFQIKHVKKSHVLKYILKGQRDNGKKVKKVSVKLLAERFESRVGFEASRSLLLARFLIDKKQSEERQFQKPKNYETETKILRKDLDALLQKYIEDYPVYNGLQITSLLNRVQSLLEEHRVELETELDDQDYEDKGTASLSDIFKSMKMIGILVGTFDPEIKEFIQFLAMRHSETLEEVNYQELIKAFSDEFNFIEDKKSRWEDLNKDGEPLPPFEPSSEEDEMESEVEQPSANKSDSQIKYSRTPSNLDDLQQNILLEKVDEILMQIVRCLPEKHKIKTLTSCMMPYLRPVFDETQSKQFLIISQDDFIHFLLGKGSNQLGLELDESHVVCLLQLLVQETGDEDDKDPDSITRFILIDEFIELVKTYMKKELIMEQSKGFGIHYDILSKESVEFLFQIRSSLMHENKINEDSEEEEYDHAKEQKSVPAQIREIFGSIISTKNIAVKRGQEGSSQAQLEVMDFEQTLEILLKRMQISFPSTKAQEELKYLFCLDYKYIELIMLVKFDKVMHDLDYISIDLLRQAQDSTLNEQRKMNLNQLRRTRDKQIAAQKKQSHDTYETRVNTHGNLGPDFNGVSQSSKQEKKRKRPDDKRQMIQKKSNTNQRSAVDQDFNGENMNSSCHEYDNIRVKTSEMHKKNRKSEPSEYEEDFLQDDIPIDDDDDEDGIISDNYEQLADRLRESEMAQAKEENGISMDHSDDIMESGDHIRKTKSEQEEIEDNYSEEVEDDERQQLMDEVIDQMQDDEDEYPEDLEGMDPEELMRLEEEVRAQMEDDDEYPDDEERDEERDEPEINDEYEKDDENYEGIKSSEDNPRGLSGTKSGIIMPAQEDEDEDDMPEETPMKSDQIKEDSDNQDNYGELDDNYENIIQGTGSKSQVESVAKSKNMSEGFNLAQSQPSKGFNEPISQSMKSIKPVGQPSLHSSQRYVQMSHNSSEQPIQQSISNKSAVIDKISNRSRHSQLQQQLIQSISQKSFRKSIEQNKQISSNHSIQQQEVLKSYQTSSKNSLAKDVKDKSQTQSQMSLAKDPVRSSKQSSKQHFDRHDEPSQRDSERLMRSSVAPASVKEQSERYLEHQSMKAPSEKPESVKKASERYSDYKSSKQPSIKPESVRDESERYSEHRSSKYQSAKHESFKQPSELPSSKHQSVKKSLQQFSEKYSEQEFKKQSSKAPSIKQESEKQPSERYSVKDPSERYSVKEPSERYSVKEPSERYSMKEASERMSVKEPSERYSVKETSEKYSVKDPSVRYSVKEPSERYSVKEPSERYSVKEPSELYSVKEPSERYSVKEPSECFSVKQPSEHYSVKSSQKLPVQAHKSSVDKFSMHSSKKSQNQIIEQASEKISERSIRDDIKVPNLHSSQRILDQKSNTSKHTSSKAKVSVMASSIKQSHASASGLNFNPMKKSTESFLKENSFHDSGKVTEKASSKKSSKPQFIAQGNFMGADDDEDNYSEEQYSQQKDEIDQDIQAGNSEVEDFPVEVPKSEVDNLFQRRSGAKEVRSSQQVSHSIKSKKSIKSNVIHSATSSKQRNIGVDNSVQVIDDNYYIEDDVRESNQDSLQQRAGRNKGLNFHAPSVGKSSQQKEDSEDYEF